MKLEVIVKALKWLEIDMDLDEVFFYGFVCRYHITLNFIRFSVQHFYLSDELIESSFPTVRWNV